MNKPLNEMTNEELWRLFPIVLSEHIPIWKENYLTEKMMIEINKPDDCLQNVGAEWRVIFWMKRIL